MPLLTPGRILIIFIVLKMPAEKMHAHPRNFCYLNSTFCKKRARFEIKLKKNEFKFYFKHLGKKLILMAESTDAKKSFK